MVDSSITGGDYVAFVVCAVCSVLNIVLLISILRTKYCTKTKLDKTKDNSILTNVSILAIFFYLIAFVLMTVSYIKLIFVDQRQGITVTTQLIRISSIFYLVSNYGFLIFILLIRINNLAVYPLWFTKIVYILPIITGLITVIPFTVIIVDVDTHKYMSPITTSSAFIVLIIYFILMIIYLKQIRSTMKQRIINYNNKEQMQLQIADNADNQVDHEVIIDFNSIESIVRYSVLVIFCVSSIFAAPIFGAIGTATKNHSSHISWISVTGGSLDMVINSICIYFLFGFAERYYFKICNLCHKCIRNCCVSSVINSFKGDVDKEQYKSLILAQ